MSAEGMADETTKNLVLFASGSGSNVENIAAYFAEDARVRISGVLCNKPQAGVVERCRRLDLPLYCFNREAFRREQGLLALLKGLQPDLIILAGFLWKIPESFLRVFPQRIINIHPALLPKFGGKGMYGMRVHEAVVREGEKESGITIHWVNEVYDQGGIIHQTRVTLSPDDQPEQVAEKVHQLEYTCYPKVIEELLFPAHG